jgi:hypothetical protein
MVVPMISLRSGFVWVAMGLSACSVDERTLALGGSAGSSSAEGGAGDPPNGGVGTGGRAPTSGASGTGTASGTGGTAEPDGAGGEVSDDGLVDGCADLDTDGVGDCTVTLVKTPTFTENVSGWTAMGDATLAWAERNALGDRPSGSAKLGATNTRAAAQQCLPLDGRKLVIAYANAFVVEGADPEHPLQAQLAVSFYDQASCAGEASGFFETPPSTESEGWVTVQAGGLSNESSRSMSIALVGVKSSADAKLEAYFDNVMLKAQEP